MELGLEAAANALKAVHGLFKERIEDKAIYMIDNSGFPKEVRDAMLRLFR